MLRAARLVLLLTLTAPAQAGGVGGWHLLDGAPAPHVKASAACPVMRLPVDWDVRAQVYADVTGDGSPECVLSVWRPWRDWPIARWGARATPIVNNRDAQGFSSHVAVLKPQRGGGFAQVWVGSALFQPVTALTVRPDGQLVTLETTYLRGRAARSVALSEWQWTGFGFRLRRRVTVQAAQLGISFPGGRVAVR